MTVREGMEGRGRGEVVNSAIKVRLFLIAKHNEVWRGGGVLCTNRYNNKDKIHIQHTQIYNFHIYLKWQMCDALNYYQGRQGGEQLTRSKIL